MNIAKTILACSLGLALTGVASAQIYESEDAEGVTEFSDTPTPGAQEVDLQQTNVATPVEEREPQAASEQRPAPEGRESGGEAVREQGGEEEAPGYNYYGGNDDELGPREQRREDADRIEDRGPHVDNSLPHEPGGEAREGAPHPEARGAAHGGGGVRR
jgi:hypothetical protein